MLLPPKKHLLIFYPNGNILSNIKLICRQRVIRSTTTTTTKSTELKDIQRGHCRKKATANIQNKFQIK